MSETAPRAVRKKSDSRKAELARRRRESRIAQEIAAEAREEALAPRAQREDVLATDGTVLRSARLEKVGISYIRSNPLRRLAARAEKKKFPLIEKRHLDAAERLISDWEQGGSGTIAMGCSNWGGVGGGARSSGTIADGVLAAIDAQTRSRDAFLAAQQRLGALWPIVHFVVLLGRNPSEFGAARGMSPPTVCGLLRGAMDILCECYEPAAEPKVRIRTIAPARASVEEPA